VRLFVAVDVPDAIKTAIERDVVEPLRPVLSGARWSRPEGRHLTLKFLGEVPAGDGSRVGVVGKAVSEAASEHVRFDAAFDILGGFPNLRRPRVLWLGIGPGSDELTALAASIEQSLGPLGFPSEDRPFHPHFTLARFPKPSVVGEMPEPAVPQQAFAVNELILFRSQLHPKGARYTALERFPLEP
jgi:RNA 2',3'-cyclic 3'-phosphodiesterase